MTDDKQKLNGCAIAVILTALPFVVVAAVTVIWILIEFGQWIGRQ
jgi:heme/copper-type cytochrome/quinol oxidase subunit 4